MDGLVQVQIVNIQRLSSSLKLTARALASSSSCTWEAGGLHNRIRMAWARTFWNYRYRRRRLLLCDVVGVHSMNFYLNGEQPSIIVVGVHQRRQQHWPLIPSCRNKNIYWSSCLSQRRRQLSTELGGSLRLTLRCLPACPLNGIPQPKSDLECQWE